MTDYISREALFKTVEDYVSTHPVMRDNELFALFCSVPAADVRPVVHGKWNNIIQGIIPSGQCSNCKAWDKVTRYCPNCGADMREEQT